MRVCVWGGGGLEGKYLVPELTVPLPAGSQLGEAKPRGRGPWADLSYRISPVTAWLGLPAQR